MSCRTRGRACVSLRSYQMTIAARLMWAVSALLSTQVGIVPVPKTTKWRPKCRITRLKRRKGSNLAAKMVADWDNLGQEETELAQGYSEVLVEITSRVHGRVEVGGGML